MSWFRKTALGGLGLGVLAGGGILADAWVPMGKGAVGARLERMQASPQWEDGVFVNPQPMYNDWKESVRTGFNMSPVATPDSPLPVIASDGSQLLQVPQTGLRMTWLGHSTQILEIDGVRVITDPIFGGRAAPVDWAGPAPWYAPPIALEDLPPLDAVLISHDHYDHLQTDTITALVALQDPIFVVPLGVGAHLEYWGVSPDRIRELDWWEQTQIGGLTVVSTPSRHASGRQVFDQMHTLWTSYALLGPEHRVWFSGDTGMFPDMDQVSQRYGPFDLTLVEVGAYDQGWPDWHMGPEQAVDAHVILDGALFVPIHWGLWNLASHGWTEPVERVVAEAERQQIRTYIPKPGESFEPALVGEVDRWWPELPWRTAQDYPVRATALD